jgi:hypothetical protein
MRVTGIYLAFTLEADYIEELTKKSHIKRLGGYGHRS